MAQHTDAQAKRRPLRGLVVVLPVVVCALGLAMSVPFGTESGQVSGLEGLLEKPLLLKAQVGEAVERVKQGLAGLTRDQQQQQSDSQDPADCQLESEGVRSPIWCQVGQVDLDTVNFIAPTVGKLTKTAFFRYFKVNLWCQCPLWEDDGMCQLEACAVCPVDKVPEMWTEEEKYARAAYSDCDSLEILERVSSVKRQLDSGEKQKLLSLPTWVGFNNPWMYDDDEHVEYEYVNLADNPEKYTGYKGEHASRIWGAMYSQSCFGSNPHSCPETSIFYRLISGLHSSINIHVAHEYLLDEEQNLWGPNMQMFKYTLGLPKLRERVENMYFSYLFVLNAIQRAAPVIESHHLCTGFEGEDELTEQLMQQLLTSPRLNHSCPVPFDEGRLWKSEQSEQLRLDLQQGFKNITNIMNCVGCEKCRLWGKVQVLGLATALKVVFSTEECTGEPAPLANKFAPLVLERNEVIALFNTLDRFAQGIVTYQELSRKLELDEGIPRNLPPDDYIF